MIFSLSRACRLDDHLFKEKNSVFAFLLTREKRHSSFRKVIRRISTCKTYKIDVNDEKSVILTGERKK